MTNYRKQGNEILQRLQKQLDSSNSQLGNADKQLVELKVLLTKLPSFEKTQGTETTHNEDLVLARSTFEVACFLNILQQDMESFERHFLQLKPFYLDFGDTLSKSSNENLLIALNLMRLLSQNRIAEFHTELELLQKETKEDSFVSFAIGLEQCLTEGSYAKLLSLSSTCPNRYFSFFTNVLFKTVQNDIADCLEIAYKELKMEEALDMLSVASAEEFYKFVNERHWELIQNRIVFHSTETENPMTGASTKELLFLIEQNIYYAKELEKIV
eukprot:jgi/Galph1/569/GphlegSOOS_G5375.1